MTVTNARTNKNDSIESQKKDNPNDKINGLMYPIVWLQVPYIYIVCVCLYNRDRLKIGMPFYMYNSDGLKTRMRDANEVLKGFQHMTIIIRTENARYVRGNSAGGFL